VRKISTFHGGVHPPENKKQSTAEPIARIPLASQLVFPLNQHIGAEAQAIVAVGDQVLKGQKLAQAQGLISANIHASTSGKIIAIEERPIIHPSGRSAPCIVLESDGEDTWIERETIEDYHSLNPRALLDKIRDAGITGMGGAGFPTAVKLTPRQPISTLIINGTECEPYITADDMLMRERADEIVAGTQLLAFILGKLDDVIIGIEDNKPEAIAAMQKAVEGTNIEVVTFPTKYPSGGEKQLIEILTGKQVPSGALPSEIGIVVQNVGTTLSAWRAVRYGEPLVNRITTVVGESVKRQRNVEVPLGTPLAHLLNTHGWDADSCARIVIGGPMMGFAVDSTAVPIVKTTNCVLVPSLAEMPAQPLAQPCIRCGMCAQACPASLLPQQLLWYAQSENFDQLRAHDLFDCIECGACSYVCPSNIPLVQYYRASKGEIRKLDQEKQKSDRSRQRFEARKARIAQAEAEREAKRLARKKAADEAKKAQAKPADNREANNDLVASAMAAAKAKTVDPAKEKAKFERALSSAQSRVTRAQKQLDEAQKNGEDAARIDTLQARLKQAQLNASEAEKKLEALIEQQLSSGLSVDKVTAKMSASPAEKIQSAILSLEKRLQTARQKLTEAESQNSANVEALQQGVLKLEQKLQQNLDELAQVNTSSDSEEKPANGSARDAAQAAIDKAIAKAAHQATLSEAEKAQQNIDSLQKRLEKAKQRLASAEAENNENIDAFRLSVEKLQSKLDQAMEQQQPGQATQS